MSWMLLWKIMLVVAMVAFAGMAVVVTVGGFHDIRKLVTRLREDLAAEERDPGAGERDPARGD